MGVIIARGRLRFQGVCFCIITQKRLVKGIQGHFFLDARCSWHARGDLRTACDLVVYSIGLIMYGQTRECGDKPHANGPLRVLFRVPAYLAHIESHWIIIIAACHRLTY